MTPIIIIIYVAAVFCTIVSFAVRNHPNGIAGYRVSYTMEYPDIWKKAHIVSFLLGAVGCIASGVAFFFVSPEAMQIIVWINLLFPVIVTLIFVYLWGRTKDREQDEREERQRMEAEREEER